jgi:hypothetical protein
MDAIYIKAILKEKKQYMNTPIVGNYNVMVQLIYMLRTNILEV